MDELRDEIWDHLYKSGQPQGLVDIATFANRDLETIRGAVDHEWFTVSNDLVGIAYASETS
jgi:hypothetical protein